MKPPPVIHLRLAERLRALAEEAELVEGRVAAAQLRAFASTVEADPDSIRKVAREARGIVQRFAEAGERSPLVKVWQAAALDASHPQRLRRPARSPRGLTALSAEERAQIQAIGTRARRALPPERQREIAQKAAATRKDRGTHRGGAAPLLSHAERREVVVLYDGGRGVSQVKIAARFGVSRSLVAKILRRHRQAAWATSAR